MKRSIFFTGMIIFGFFGFCLAEEIDLEKIVVTPYRYAEVLSKTTASITVITPDDIKNSNAQNTVDMLRSVPGVTVRDWYGNGVKASVDMAGFGEQAALNVLVLVDGRRVNDVDLSGVDWSQVPLEQVERIEVIRGGSAAVLYGDNASSGVINIITKKGSGKPKVDLRTEYGSYDMNKQRLSLSGGVDSKLSYWFSAGREATHGYRNNSFYKARDFASKLAYDFSDTLSVHFDSGFHASSYGMPASINQAVIDQHSRRYARNGDDHANNKDYYFVVGTKSDITDLGGFDIDFSYRRKDTDSYFLTSGLDTLKNKIETFGITSKYTLGNSILDHDNKLIAGVDFYRSLYNSKTLYYSKTLPNLNGELNQYTNINKNSFGSYLQDEFSISKKLVLVTGYRYEFARYTFGYHDNDLHGWGKSPDQDNKVKPEMKAFNSGLTYAYKDDSNVFLNIGKSFRFPEVDEFTYTDANWQKQLNTDLKAQSSINYQLGLRHKLSDQIKGSLSIFRMNVKNELYYNAKDFLSWGSWVGKNANYDKTVHEGFECSIDVKPNNWMALFGNYTFTNAYFDGGQYSKNEIPLVPRHKASIGLKFILPRNITFNITGTYLGQRYFLNDQANAYSRLNGYMVADTNLSWNCKNLRITFGINNLFNKKYSEYAGVTVDDGVKFYYPSPERNFSLKLEYKF
ncbi:MAG: TonB-dependent receptor [Candidatus Omnitrophota bacterium]|nr:TonB-dependent receptor [Candidatus Omnitrophota bacterium]